MNKDRRKAIDAAIALIDAAFSQLEEARSAVEDIQSEEQEYFDNLPESFQNSDKGSVAQEALDNIEAALSDIEQIDWEGIKDQLESAKG